MESPKKQKITRLIKNWKRGAVLTSHFLEANGFNSQLISWYKSTGWIESVGRGAYKLAGDKIDWYGAIFALQTQLGFTTHPGGKTALELQGYAHYLAEKPPVLYLFGLREERLPKWFHNYDWGTEIHYAQTKLFPKPIPQSLHEYSYKEFAIRISSPERSALEMLYHVPKYQGFAEASYLMENLTTLRPQLVQNLLEQCNSIKVKRLFLYFAEKHEHQWFGQLKINRINLGTGKRVVVKNGILDKKYQITVLSETYA